VLFVGLRPVAIVEAKRKSRRVSGDLKQSRRYSRELQAIYGETLVATAHHFLRTAPEPFQH